MKLDDCVQMWLNFILVRYHIVIVPVKRIFIHRELCRIFAEVNRTDGNFSRFLVIFSDITQLMGDKMSDRKLLAPLIEQTVFIISGQTLEAIMRKFIIQNIPFQLCPTAHPGPAAVPVPS